MNKNSLICKFISKSKNINEALELIRNKHIKINEDNNYIVFNYEIDADFSDPIVCEARGIIIDKHTLEVVCWPFTKFFNVHEQYAAKIDWNTASVQEKLDGSIVKLYWDKYNKEWAWATNSTINAKDANISGSLTSFKYLIEKASNIDKINSAIKKAFDKEFTYIFELTSPLNRIVIKYQETKLTLIGIRNNITGKEFSPPLMAAGLGIDMPKYYNFNSLESCINIVKILNKDLKDIQSEGLIVVDSNFNRIKIKTPEYIEAHLLATERIPSKKRAITTILNSDSLDKLLNRANNKSVYLYYAWQIEELLQNADMIANKARALYEEYDHDRKAVAKELKGDKLSTVGFKALDTDLRGRDIILKNYHYIINAIDNYRIT